MAKKIIKTTFQLRRGNSDTYTQKNILLAAGEPAFELDTGRLKIGDGETLWNDLDYINDKEFVYKPGGSRETLPNLNDSNIGYVYNITEGFITTEDFIEGAGKYYSAGTDVTIIKINEDLYYNVYGGFVDLSGYATKTDLNNLAESKQDRVIGGKGVEITDDANVGLTDKFYNYLVRATFEKPTIAAFAVTGLGGAMEIGTSVTVSEFTHRETNIDNFYGTLTLKKGTDVLAENIAPSSAAASGSFTSQPVTSSTAATVTFTLSGTDALGDSVSQKVSKTFYVPKIYGVSENSTVTAEDLEGMTRVQSYPSPTTVQVLANGYIFLAVTGTITKVINADTGFGVAVTQLENKELSINDVNKTYHVYRTDELTSQTLKLAITVS